jgi:hypothetical protein
MEEEASFPSPEILSGCRLQERQDFQQSLLQKREKIIMYDRLIYSEREIKSEEIVAALKKAYPNIGIGDIEDGYFCFETVDNHGFVYLEEYEKDGITPKDYGITLENLGDQISYFKDKEHISCIEIDGSDPEFIDHVTDDILSTIPGAVIADRDGKPLIKK